MISSFIPMMFPQVPKEANMYACQKVPKAPSLKIKFTEAEDDKLSKLVSIFGCKDWIMISKLMETRNPRQCRERWKNYLNPELRKDPWTPEEDKLLCQKHDELGAKWNKIARFFNNRSDNSLRNRWMLISRRKSKMQNDSVENQITCKPVESVQKQNNVLDMNKDNDNNNNIYPKVEIMPYTTVQNKFVPLPEVRPLASSPNEFNDFSFPDEGLFDNQMKFGTWDIFSF